MLGHAGLCSSRFWFRGTAPHRRFEAGLRSIYPVEGIPALVQTCHLSRGAKTGEYPLPAELKVFFSFDSLDGTGASSGSTALQEKIRVTTVLDPSTTRIPQLSRKQREEHIAVPKALSLTPSNRKLGLLESTVETVSAGGCEKCALFYILQNDRLGRPLAPDIDVEL